jgi:hypothetical protein
MVIKRRPIEQQHDAVRKQGCNSSSAAQACQIHLYKQLQIMQFFQLSS